MAFVVIEFMCNFNVFLNLLFVYLVEKSLVKCCGLDFSLLNWM